MARKCPSCLAILAIVIALSPSEANLLVHESIADANSQMVHDELLPEDVDANAELMQKLTHAVVDPINTPSRRNSMSRQYIEVAHKCSKPNAIELMGDSYNFCSFFRNKLREYYNVPTDEDAIIEAWREEFGALEGDPSPLSIQESISSRLDSTFSATWFEIIKHLNTELQDGRRLSVMDILESMGEGIFRALGEMVSCCGFWPTCYIPGTHEVCASINECVLGLCVDINLGCIPGFHGCAMQSFTLFLDTQISPVVTWIKNTLNHVITSFRGPSCPLLNLFPICQDVAVQFYPEGIPKLHMGDCEKFPIPALIAAISTTGVNLGGAEMTKTTGDYKLTVDASTDRFSGYVQILSLDVAPSNFAFVVDLSVGIKASGKIEYLPDNKNWQTNGKKLLESFSMELSDLPPFYIQVKAVKIWFQVTPILTIEEASVKLQTVPFDFRVGTAIDGNTANQIHMGVKKSATSWSFDPTPTLTDLPMEVTFGTEAQPLVVIDGQFDLCIKFDTDIVPLTKPNKNTKYKVNVKPKVCTTIHIASAIAFFAGSTRKTMIKTIDGNTVTVHVWLPNPHIALPELTIDFTPSLRFEFDLSLPMISFNPGMLLALVGEGFGVLAKVIGCISTDMGSILQGIADLLSIAADHMPSLDFGVKTPFVTVDMDIWTPDLFRLNFSYPTPPIVVTGPGCFHDTTTNCVYSTNHPWAYEDNSQCSIEFHASLLLNSAAFNTEAKKDKLIIGGSEYSGVSKISNVKVQAGDIATWSSDSSGTKSGWKICAKPFSELMVVSKGNCVLSTSQHIFPGCVLSHDNILRAPYNSHDECDIVVTRDGAITSKYFDTEKFYDKLEIEISGSTQEWSGTDGPIMVPVTADSTITWTSDPSNQKGGWIICPAIKPSHIRVGDGLCKENYGPRTFNGKGLDNVGTDEEITERCAASCFFQQEAKAYAPWGAPGKKYARGFGVKTSGAKDDPTSTRGRCYCMGNTVQFETCETDWSYYDAYEYNTPSLVCRSSPFCVDCPACSLT